MTTETDVRIEQLRSIAARIRSNSLKMVHRAGVGHPGGDLSASDILATLFFGVLRGDPERCMAEGRDRFVLSKGHAAASLYATLAEAGYFPPEWLERFASDMSPLNGHPDRNKVPGVEANTGPLGHGMPVATGMALAAKLKGEDWRVYVLTGDGELQEGSNWEAGMTAAHYHLDNLTLIVDRNRIQQGAPTEETICMEPLAERWRSFGWNVTEVDGHDHAALLDLFIRQRDEKGRPHCIIANTHKGQGVSFMMDQAAWHHRVPTGAELAAALKELNA